MESSGAELVLSADQTAPNNAGAATNNAGAAPNNAGEAPNKAGAARIFPEENVKFAKLAGFPQIKSGFRLFESKVKDPEQ